MQNPDDPDFEDFVLGAMNTSFSSAYNDDDDDSDLGDVLINNIANSSESESEAIDQTALPADLPCAAVHPADAEPNRAINHPTPVAGPSAQGQSPPPQQQSRSWTNVTDTDPGPAETIPIYNVNTGPVLPTSFDGETEPIDYFYLFFSDDLMNHICKETNIFASKRKAEANSPRSRMRTWNNISTVEMKAFLGTVINMGLMPLPSIESYFSTAWEGRIPFFSDVFSKDEFLNIFWNLHFNSRNNQEPVPKGFHIAPILDHIKKKSQLFYVPKDRISIDESTISFKGRVSFRVYNPMKPTKFGLKIFVASDSTNGYMFDFIPYYGSGDIIEHTNLLKTTQIVKVLTKSIVLQDEQNPRKGVHIYTDRYYTSPQLADELKKLGCYITGTVMTNRTGMPPHLKTKGKKMKKGDIYAQRKGSTVVVSWKDKRPVHMLSTFHKGSKQHMTNVQSRWPGKPPTPKPNVVLDYIKHMGGVDRSDHFISSYQFMRRTKKWYRKLFFWLLEVALINSYLLYKCNQESNNLKPLSHRMFRKRIVKSLVQEKVATRRNAKRRGRPAQGPPEERLNGLPHFMDRRVKGSSPCQVCKKRGMRKESIYFCKTCTSKPALHPDTCFELYHTVNDF